MEFLSGSPPRLRVLRRPPLRVGAGTAWLVVANGSHDVCANVLYLLTVRLGTLTVAATLTSLCPASTIVRLAWFSASATPHSNSRFGVRAIGVVLIDAG